MKGRRAIGLLEWKDLAWGILGPVMTDSCTHTESVTGEGMEGVLCVGIEADEWILKKQGDQGLFLWYLVINLNFSNGSVVSRAQNG